MSTRATGNAREHRVEEMLWEHGFRTMLARASGQRKKAAAKGNALRGDIIAISAWESGLPHLLVEAGGIGKRLGVTFAELTEHPLPSGFVPVVVRCVKRAWKWYLSPDDRFDSLDDALAALRAS
jgi:hypothetical protein